MAVTTYLFNEFFNRIASFKTLNQLWPMKGDFGQEQNQFYLSEVGRNSVVLIEIKFLALYKEEARMMMILARDDRGPN